MSVRILQGDCRDVLKTLPDQSVHCVVTSPPYFGLRDYGVKGQMGMEASPEDFVAGIVAVFSEARRVLRDDGALWLNLGDSYARNGGTHGGGNRELMHLEGNQKRMGKIPSGSGLKEKDLVGIPWRVAFALQADGWYLRQDIIWSKPNPMPESVTDRCTKAHEYIFLLSKSPQYYYDADSIREPHIWADDKRNDGKRHTCADDAKHNQVDHNRQRTKTDCVSFHPLGRNKRSVWTVPTTPFKEAHFATFPPELIRPCIRAGCPRGGTVLDPFGGAGTTGLVADQEQRDAILIELNPEYAAMAELRIKGGAPLLAEISA